MMSVEKYTLIGGGISETGCVKVNRFEGGELDVDRCPP